MRNIPFQIILFIVLINVAFPYDRNATRSIETSQIVLDSSDLKLDLSAFKIKIVSRILNQPIILTSGNLGEWEKIYFNVIPPDNYSSSFSIDVSMDSGNVWNPIKEPFYFEFYPDENRTYVISIRVLTKDNAGIKAFNKYPISYIKSPEIYYPDLIKKFIAYTFNNKEPSFFLKYISNSYSDSKNNRYDEIEDKLDLEFEKYNNIKFSLKKFNVVRSDLAKFKVSFHWTKSYENKANNTIENIFGKSVFIFKNDLIIKTGGDSIFFNSAKNMPSSIVSGILKAGTITLIPDESFEFSSEIFYKGDKLKGDLGIKKDGINLSLYVPGGMIQDMGITPLSAIKEAPETDYHNEAPVIIGHSYCLRNSNNRYAKFQITYVEGAEIGQTSFLISINWIYQEKESRILRPQ